MSFYMKFNCCCLLIHTYSYNISQLNSGICRLMKLGHMLVTGDDRIKLHNEEIRSRLSLKSLIFLLLLPHYTN